MLLQCLLRPSPPSRACTVSLRRSDSLSWSSGSRCRGSEPGLLSALAAAHRKATGNLINFPKDTSKMHHRMVNIFASRATHVASIKGLWLALKVQRVPVTILESLALPERQNNCRMTKARLWYTDSPEAGLSSFRQYSAMNR